MSGRKSGFARFALAGVLLVAGASAPVLARAQTPSTTPAATPEELAEARRIFAVGVQHADRGEWEEAVVCFRQVLEVREAPPVLYNLGAALVALGEYPEAEPLLTRVVNDPSAEASIAQRARDSIDTMNRRAGRITLRLVDAPPGAIVYVDRKVLPPAQLGVEIPLSAGEHELSVRLGSTEITRRTLRVAIGSHEEALIEVNAVSDETLAAQDAIANADAQARASHTQIGTTRDRSELRRRRLRSPWLWGGVGGGIVVIIAVVVATQHEPSVDAPTQGNFGTPVVRF